MDKRHHYFLILDCETATIPFVNEIDEEKKKQISVILPLVYDIGWKIIDSKGRTYCARSYIVSEIFSNPTLFNTAYYKDKRPLYIDSIAKGEAEISTWFSICNALRADLEKVEAIGAYNADFDFFRAIRFTNNYISKAYSNNFEKWYNSLKDYFVSPHPRKTKEKEDKSKFTFCGVSVPVFDIWHLACKYLLNTKTYKKFCKDNELLTASGKFYQTNAESAYKYITKNTDFKESHTALQDADIEGEILTQILKRKGKIDFGIKPFPFQILGKVLE